jgi:trehalose 6-phosphate phosphatase
MRDLLALRNRSVLGRLLRGRPLLAFDYDGTLAPIVSDPELAAMRDRTRRLLSELAHLRPCVVISGRSRADVARRLRGVAVRGVVGNHGLDPWHGAARVLREVRAWLSPLRRGLAGFRGVEIEDKLLSVTVHFRRSRRKEAVQASLRRVASGLNGARLVPGKQVLNLVPRGAPHKGVALEQARRRLRCDTALFVGDDQTDEDAFSLSRHLLAVRVGRHADSLAPYFIRSQREVDALLRRLLELARSRDRPARGRRAPGGRSGARTRRREALPEISR